LRKQQQEWLQRDDFGYSFWRACAKAAARMVSETILVTASGGHAKAAPKMITAGPFWFIQLLAGMPTAAARNQNDYIKTRF